MSDVRNGVIIIEYEINGDDLAVRTRDTGDLNGLEAVGVVHVAMTAFVNGDDDAAG